MFTVNNKDTERRHGRRSGAFTVEFEGGYQKFCVGEKV